MTHEDFVFDSTNSDGGGLFSSFSSLLTLEATLLSLLGLLTFLLYAFCWRPFFARYSRTAPLPPHLDRFVMTALNLSRNNDRSGGSEARVVGGGPLPSSSSSSSFPQVLDVHMHCVGINRCIFSGCHIHRRSGHYCNSSSSSDEKSSSNDGPPSWCGIFRFLLRHPKDFCRTLVMRYACGVQLFPSKKKRTTTNRPPVEDSLQQNDATPVAVSGIEGGNGGEEERSPPLFFGEEEEQFLHELVAQMNGARRYVDYRGMLLAMDKVYPPPPPPHQPQYGSVGTRAETSPTNPSLDIPVGDDSNTALYVPNSFVMKVCERHPELFSPCISVHPYRGSGEAIRELKKYHKLGCRMVKWLPNSQRIDPSNEELCGAFYAKMIELEMVLLCHVGDEHTLVAGRCEQRYGDPRRLRLPLDMGLKVIMAHCGSEGIAEDGIPNFNLFVAMMEEKKYHGLLFGDLSALPGFKRVKIFKKLLKFHRIHSRLCLGSDYPAPCIPFAPLTIVHWWHGLITWEERSLLNELYRYNPILFNLVLLSIVGKDPKLKLQPINFSRYPTQLQLYDTRGGQRH